MTPLTPNAVLSDHASLRVFDRLSLSHREIVDILNSEDPELTLTLGVNKGKKHRLFYSEKDDECFVAVQDEHDGTIITILLPDFDRHCRISPDVISDFKLSRRRQSCV
ncbi:MAG: hypothetical protein Q7R78_00110 [bacterium]|nr:hypothetical protein [bacterium]